MAQANNPKYIIMNKVLEVIQDGLALNQQLEQYHGDLSPLKFTLKEQEDILSIMDHDIKKMQDIRLLIQDPARLNFYPKQDNAKHNDDDWINPKGGWNSWGSAH